MGGREPEEGVADPLQTPTSTGAYFEPEALCGGVDMIGGRKDVHACAVGYLTSG
jgi:hypothetical protein